jgi:hypothetical protein
MYVLPVASGGLGTGVLAGAFQINYLANLTVLDNPGGNVVNITKEGELGVCL